MGVEDVGEARPVAREVSEGWGVAVVGREGGRGEESWEEEGEDLVVGRRGGVGDGGGEEDGGLRGGRGVDEEGDFREGGWRGGGEDERLDEGSWGGVRHLGITVFSRTHWEKERNDVR